MSDEMKEYTIKLCEYEIGILEECFNARYYEEDLLRGILQQILEQK